MKPALLFALAAAALAPSAAGAIAVRFGGTFADNVLPGTSSQPGADFSIRFDTPLLILDEFRGIRQVDAAITFGGVERVSRAFFNPVELPSGISAFTLSFSSFFSFSGTNFTVTGIDFFDQVTQKRGRLKRGVFDLQTGNVIVNTGFKQNVTPILNLSELRIGVPAASTSSFDTLAAPRLLATVGVAQVSETGSVALLAGGFGLLAFALNSRRRGAVQA